MQQRIIIILSIMLLSVTKTSAQYDVSFSHFWDMEPYYNPAAAGKENKLNIAAAYAMSFTGFENNPKSMYIGADMPIYFLKKYHGVGVSLLNDQIGLFTHQRLALQYAYKQKLFGGTLSIGLQLGFISEKFDGSKVDVEDSSDPALTKSDVNGSAMDLAAGIYYTHGSWYVGVSAQHINAPLVELGETNELQIDRTIYLTGGYNIKLRNPFLTIHPSALIRTDGSSYRADIAGLLVYTNDKKMLYGGVAYSPSNSVTAHIGGLFHGVKIGYSYEIYTSGISLANGSHELFIGYQTTLNLYKKGKNKHKSVRLL
ncbi:MAG: type IX secretion system membrane protein PorP/SprF [Prevotella sp.]|nr:type IX secretion system membrane protein PorP/SprF [Prevotella sp.]